MVGTLFWKEMSLFAVLVPCLGFINQLGCPVVSLELFRRTWAVPEPALSDAAELLPGPAAGGVMGG